LPGTLLDWGTRPEPAKTYSKAPRIRLPDPRGFRGLSLEEAVEARRSRREYAPGPLSLEELSRLLHAASGVTDPARGFRAAPSAGALYPIETYVVAHEVVELESGLYHYNVADHALEKLREKELRAAMVVAGLGQEMLGRAQVCFILSAVFQRTRWRYRGRTYRYVMLEAGHLGQNLYLAATSMGLGACAVGAFLDDNLNRLLGLDGREEAVVYVVTVGRVAR
jgi:SagB-type dehydrogenase family enzyme